LQEAGREYEKTEDSRGQVGNIKSLKSAGGSQMIEKPEDCRRQAGNMKRLKILGGRQGILKA
jgi:hypothetical protein